MVKKLIRIKLHNSGWMGKASVLLVEIGFQELLCKGGSDGRDTVEAGSSLQASP